MASAVKFCSNVNSKFLMLYKNKSVPSISAKCFSSQDSWVPVDKKTHTGQQWEEDDYRLARFIDKPKHVNTKFAIDLIDQVPPAPREERVVWCDGGGGPVGHPKVYINLDKPGNHTCGYCGLRFYKDDHGHH